LASATERDAVLAVSSAGAIPYFSERPAIDILGKSDPHIAASDPLPGPFLPGHTKRDYAYSFGELQPDVITQIFGPIPPELAGFMSERYRHVGGMLWFRTDSTAVDPDRLTAIASLQR
jgi:hypothetical protein